MPLDGRSPENVWEILVQHAQNIHNRAFAYDPIPILPHQANSNALIANLLHLVGIDPIPLLPNPVFGTAFPYLGQDQVLNFDYTINGTSGNDLIQGRGGKQVFFGGAGNDRLFGGDNADSLIGGAGNDVLSGGRDNDSLVGGDGIDTARYESNYTQFGRIQYRVFRADNGEDFIVDASPTRGDRPPFDGTDTLSKGVV